MEPKKNPKYDIHRQRGVIFNISLVISLLLVITAFKWTAPFAKISRPPETDYFESDPLTFIPIIRDKQTEPKKASTKAVLPTPNFKEVKNEGVENPVEPIDQSDPDPEMAIGNLEVPREILPDTAVFIAVEEMPEPLGGWSAFFATLKKNLKYPRQAQRMGISGKVFIGFTVNQRGELTDLKVIKGLGYGCDEEATRVLSLTKWTPGKQRGRPVRVRMAQPINFRID